MQETPLLSVNGGIEAGGQSGVRTEVNSIRKSWGWQGEARRPWEEGWQHCMR